MIPDSGSFISYADFVPDEEAEAYLEEEARTGIEIGEDGYLATKNGKSSRI